MISNPYVQLIGPTVPLETPKIDFHLDVLFYVVVGEKIKSVSGH